MKKYTQPTLGGVRGGTLRLFSDNPQTYPHLLWISDRRMAADLLLRCDLAKVRAQKMRLRSQG
jgi:hypothetical protein